MMLNRGVARVGARVVSRMVAKVMDMILYSVIDLEGTIQLTKGLE